MKFFRTIKISHQKRLHLQLNLTQITYKHYLLPSFVTNFEFSFTAKLTAFQRIIFGQNVSRHIF